MIIAIAHQKGGCSKTTLALNLAVELHASDCFDLDLTKGGTTGISFLNQLRSNAGFKKLNITPIRTKEDLIKGIESDTDKKIIIMDLGGLDSDVNRIALAYADIVITPANDSALEIGGLIEFSRMLTEISASTGKEINAHIIAARTNHSRKKWQAFEDVCSKRANLVFTGLSMPLYIDYVEALVTGQSVVEYNKNCNAASHMIRIVNHIKSILLPN